jgi:hypothetical protein
VTAQLAGNPVNLAFSANSLLTMTQGASDTLPFGSGSGIPSVALALSSSTTPILPSPSAKVGSHRIGGVDQFLSYLRWNAIRPEMTTISGIGTQ